jgi:hypothetical protein
MADECGALRTRAKVIALVSCSAVSLGTWGCSSDQAERVTKPRAPDMSALISEYETPNGVLDQSTLPQLAQYVENQLARLLALGADSELIDDLRSAVQDVTASRTQSIAPPARSLRTVTVEGDGYLVATRICNGWGSVPVADRDANGALVLTIGFSEAGVDPVIWGNAERCHYLVGTSQVSIDSGSRAGDGDLRIYVGQNLSFEQLGTGRTLFDLDLSTSVDGTTTPIALDFGYDPSTRTFELAFDPGGGTLVAFASGQGLLGIRAQNGPFTCDATARTCQDPGGRVLSY